MRVTHAPASENKLKVDLGKVGAYSRGLELLYRCANSVPLDKLGCVTSIQSSANTLLTVINESSAHSH